MKKKIIFMVINMNIGGTEKALLSMIDEINREDWDVTILMLEKFGGFFDEIPDWVNGKYVEEYKAIKPFVQNPPIEMARKLIKEKMYFKGIKLACLYSLSKALKNSAYLYKYILRDVKPLYEEYDVAVAYAGPMDLITYFVQYKISAKKKVQWIHFDVRKVGFDKGLVNSLYPKFNKIFVVSEEGKNKLVEMFPKLKDNTEIFHNIVSKRKILEGAEIGESFQDDYDGIRILTVGRLSYEKGQDLIIPVLAKLRDNEYRVRWYCIGEGAYRKQCEELIYKYQLEKDFILLGSKKNSYSYMKDCDIYVQPSRHEGYCITLAEAKCFDNPIVTTNFTGAEEQIKDKETGLICKVSREGIYKSIKKLMDNEQLCKKISLNLKSRDEIHCMDIDKLDKLIND